MTTQANGPEQRVGSTLANKYHLKSLLGAGGMGAVYEAENLGTGRRVAVKVMLAEAARDGQAAARFLREARVASRVVHPNIVEVLDLDRDPVDNAPYIVQEFLVGRELAAAIEERGGPFELREALDIMAPVMRALVVAHSRNVVHRDLKPANIFLAQNANGDRVPKVIDFGIAKLTGDDASEGGLSLTRTGAAMGTPYYMSPEQARGMRAIDAQTDVWSIGVVLFEMLAGRRPFEAENYHALLFSLMEPPPRLEVVCPSVPKEVADVIHQALTLDRTRRFATMQQFLDALLVAGRVSIPPGAAPSTESPRVSAPIMDAAATTGPLAMATTLGQSAHAITIDPQNPPRKRSSALTAVGAVVVIGALAGGGWWLASGTRAQPAASRAPTVATTVPVTNVTPTVYRVALSASPATAVIALDGVDTGANTLVRELPHDGRPHRIVASAPGFVPQTVAFQDSPPPEHIELAAVPVAPPPVAVADTPVQPARSSATHRNSAAADRTAHPHPAENSGAAASPSTPTIHPTGSQVQREYP